MNRRGISGMRARMSVLVTVCPLQANKALCRVLCLRENNATSEGTQHSQQTEHRQLIRREENLTLLSHT